MLCSMLVLALLSAADAHRCRSRWFRQGCHGRRIWGCKEDEDTEKELCVGDQTELRNDFCPDCYRCQYCPSDSAACQKLGPNLKEEGCQVMCGQGDLRSGDGHCTDGEVSGDRGEEVVTGRVEPIMGCPTGYKCRRRPWWKPINCVCDEEFGTAPGSLDQNCTEFDPNDPSKIIDIDPEDERYPDAWQAFYCVKYSWRTGVQWLGGVPREEPQGDDGEPATESKEEKSTSGASTILTASMATAVAAVAANLF